MKKSINEKMKKAIEKLDKTVAKFQKHHSKKLAKILDIYGIEYLSLAEVRFDGVWCETLFLLKNEYGEVVETYSIMKSEDYEGLDIYGSFIEDKLLKAKLQKIYEEEVLTMDYMPYFAEQIEF